MKLCILGISALVAHLLKVPAVLRKAVVSKYRKTNAADSAEVTLVIS